MIVDGGAENVVGFETLIYDIPPCPVILTLDNP
jgi:hypothetical protein